MTTTITTGQQWIVTQDLDFMSHCTYGWSSAALSVGAHIEVITLLGDMVEARVVGNRNIVISLPRVKFVQYMRMISPLELLAAEAD